MNSVAKKFVLICHFPVACVAQNLSCGSPVVYMDGGAFIRAYDPSLPVSQTNPSLTAIPAFGNGLALMPNINGGTVCPTFYTTSGGTYYYWDGTSWVSTGHTTGNSMAMNLAGCNGLLYNLVGNSGDVYVYDGTSNGSLLTTLNGFGGGGPFDLAADCNCNFYALRTSTLGTGQSLTKYSPSGTPVSTYSVVNMPHVAGGMGLAVVGNNVFVRNGLTNGFFVGTISGPSVTFTQVVGFSVFPGDFATCPTCTVPPIAAQISSATISCSTPTVQLAVTTTVFPVSYAWSGPGIIGPATGSAISVSAGGVYTCVVAGLGCTSGQATLTSAVPANTAVVSATLSPSGNICILPGEQTTLKISHGAPAFVSWSGPGITNSVPADSLVVSGPGSFTVSVTNTVNGCSFSDAANFVQTPTVQVALSSPTMCAMPFGSSPSGIVISASGAMNYTFLPDGYYSVNAPNASTMLATAVFPVSATAAGTLIGANGFCVDTAVTGFMIYGNPTVTTIGNPVCPGESATLAALGASSYTWTGPLLSKFTGSLISATPLATSAYTIEAEAGGCFASPAVALMTVKPLPSVQVSAASATVCLGSSATLSVSGTAQTFSWLPGAGLAATVSPVVAVSPTSLATYSVVGELAGCTSTGGIVLDVQTPPVLTLSLSSNSMCYNGYNGSVSSIKALPGGAGSYTLLGGMSCSVSSAAGPLMQILPAGFPPSSPVLSTVTLVGKLHACTVSSPFTLYVIPNPVVKISPPSASICPGERQVFHVSGAAAYQWAASPSIQMIGPTSITVNPAVSGFFAVVGSSLGCNSETRHAHVLVKPLPDIVMQSPSSTVCAGTSSTLSAIGTADSYSWYPSAYLSSGFSATVIAAPLTTQQYTLVASLNSCTRQAMSTISVIPVPAINAAANPSAICNGGKSNLSVSGAMSYSWSPQHFLGPSVGSSVVALPHTSTTFTVRGFNGTCNGSATVHVKTVQLPRLSVFSEDGHNSVCQGESLVLRAEGADDYTWSHPQLVKPEGLPGRVLVSPLVSTDFSVTGANLDAQLKCAVAMSFSVMVIPRAVAKVAPGYSICLGDVVSIEAEGGTTYQWSPPKGLNSTSASRVLAGPQETTIYTVEVSHNSVCGSKATVRVNVYPRPSVFAGNDTSCNMNDAVMLNATGTGTISWISGERIGCAECPSTQVFPEHSGCYVAQVRNDFGCVAFDEVCVQVDDDFMVYVPNSFTPNGDGLNDRFSLFGANISELKLEIYDRWGTLKFRTSDAMSGWDGTFMGAPCKPDTYVYRLSYEGSDRKTYYRSGHLTLLR